MSERARIRDLHPETAYRLGQLLDRAAAVGLRVQLFEGYRSNARQAELYSHGRDVAGNIANPSLVVTRAKPGQSWHNHGLAVDVVFSDAKNQPIWKGDWSALGLLGEAVGFSWGGRWKSPDSPHFEFHPGFERGDPVIPVEIKMRSYWERLRPAWT